MDTRQHPIMIPISISAAGDNVIVAGVLKGWLYIHQLLLVADGGANLVELKKGTGGGTILGYVPLTAGNGFIIENTRPDYPFLFDIEQDEDFILNLANATSVKGYLIYSVRV